MREHEKDRAPAVPQNLPMEAQPAALPVQPAQRPLRPTLADVAALRSGGPLSTQRQATTARGLQRRFGNAALQRAASQSGSFEASPDVEQAIDASRGGGQPLDASLRERMESAFGSDFGGVRVHTGTQADALNCSLSARAFTTGQDIFFRNGEYSPGSSAGQELLAHELTHVVQQTGTVQAKLTVGAADDVYEQEAERASKAVMSRFNESGAVNLKGRSQSLKEKISCSPISTDQQLVPPIATGGSLTMRTIKVWLHAFIPQASIPDPFGNCFAGDGRGYSNFIHASYRTHQEIEIDPVTLSPSINYRELGVTHLLDCKTGSTLKSAKAPISELRNRSVTRAENNILISFSAAASNPLASVVGIPPPAIDLDLTFVIDPVARLCFVVGDHDGFPGYEAYITTDGGSGIFVYGYNPLVTDAKPTALFFPMDIAVRSSPVKF